MEVGWWRDEVRIRNYGTFLFSFSFLAKKLFTGDRYIKLSEKEYDHYKFASTIKTHPCLLKEEEAEKT